jgi:Flp pilus assembly protein TadG
MPRNHPHPSRRRGATAVETAVVILITLMFIFGIVEYGRLLFFFHAADNAAREGARYAVVHTGDGTTAGTPTDVPVFNADGTFKSGPGNTTVDAVVTYTLGTQKTMMTGYNISVFNAAPATGLPIAGNWYDAPFGGSIGVKVTGTYRFILPTLLGFSAPTMPINIQSVMNSEAN